MVNPGYLHTYTTLLIATLFGAVFIYIFETLLTMLMSAELTHVGVK